MGLLIDASVLIKYERGRLDLEARLSPRAEEELFLSVVTASELLHGVHRAKDTAIKAKRSAFVEAVLERFPLLPIDLATARTHSRISADLSAQGKVIGPNDLWLAAACLTHNLAIATGNVREFVRVPGLVVESWGL